MIWFSALFLWNVFHGTSSAVLGFSQRSTFVTGGRRGRIITHVGTSSRQSNYGNNHPHNTLTMRDASASYWFQVGDTVEVVQDVLKAHGTINLRGKVGTVVTNLGKMRRGPDVLLCRTGGYGHGGARGISRVCHGGEGGWPSRSSRELVLSALLCRGRARQSQTTIRPSL